ncbi:MAG: hypothetical protein EOO63_09060 [Hymenobacter sp.]|nr:MAG: hypothetical protein EOO63_09060 [Hymenobacter sp.]
MLLNLNTDPAHHSACALTYEEEEGWLCATWQGYVDPLEAQDGAAAYLFHATQQPCPLLLNDNAQLHGPWFDSLEWLGEVWVPQAARLGLRYVAHVVQADRLTDTISEHFPLSLPFELQIFHILPDAKQWLRQCRQASLGQAA